MVGSGHGLGSNAGEASGYLSLIPVAERSVTAVSRSTLDRPVTAPPPSGNAGSLLYYSSGACRPDCTSYRVLFWIICSQFSEPSFLASGRQAWRSFSSSLAHMEMPGGWDDVGGADSGGPSQPPPASIGTWECDLLINPETTITCVKVPVFDSDNPVSGTKAARECLF